MENIMVGIYCLTYNHVKYIEQTLNSFLNQKTNFKYKIFVFDDASTDGTSDILREYKRKYPELFDVYIAEKNTYKSPERRELETTLQKKYMIGKYAAICEGDDYWIDENKLQIQVDYMEQHPECVMTLHGAIWYNCEMNEKYEYNPYLGSRELTAEDIIMQYNGGAPTASLVAKREVFIQDENFPVCDVGDYPKQLCAISMGKVYYFDRPMSLYRYMHDGSWNKNVYGKLVPRIKHSIGMTIFLHKYDIYTNYKFHELIRKRQAEYLYSNIFAFKDLNCNEYIERCECELSVLSDWHSYCVGRQNNIFEIVKQKYLMNETEKQKFLNYEYIVIMGNGEFAGYLDKTLKNNNIKICGKIVTYKTEDDSDNIWQLKEYPYEKDKTLVVIGISQVHEKEIMKALHNNDYTHFYTPMWFDFESFFGRGNYEVE